MQVIKKHNTQKHVFKCKELNGAEQLTKTKYKEIFKNDIN